MTSLDISQLPVKVEPIRQALYDAVARGRTKPQLQVRACGIVQSSHACSAI